MSSPKKLGIARLLSRKLSLSEGGEEKMKDTPRLKGEERIIKFGKKLDGKYVLISAYIKPPARLRFVVYEEGFFSRAFFLLIYIF